MAKKEESKIVLERTYNVPLRREWLKVPRYKRAAKAARGLRAFLIKHMKSDDVKIGKYLNESIWKKGMRNPPHHIQVEAKKDDKGAVFAELVGAPKEKEIAEKEKEEKKKTEEVKKEAPEEKKKTAETKTENKENEKTEEKEGRKIKGIN